MELQQISVIFHLQAVRKSRTGKLEDCDWRTARGEDCVTGEGDIVGTGGQVGGDGGQGGNVDNNGVGAELEGRQQLRRFVWS